MNKLRGIIFFVFASLLICFVNAISCEDADINGDGNVGSADY
ncbi:MAG: hypothetical protein ACP5D2_01005 [Candidatus Nanoarchaeia archaeon]